MLKSNRFYYLILAALFIAAFLIWLAIFEQAPSNVLEIDFFDVGEGDSIFIETSQHHQVLIDGGPSLVVLEKLSQVMPFYDQSIDLVILTHPDDDHITGLVEVLKDYKIGRVIVNGLDVNSVAYNKWQELIKEKNIPVTIAQTGQQITLDQGVFLKILWPNQAEPQLFSEKTNNGSVVSQLVYGDKEILLTGDIERVIEGRLINLFGGQLTSDILKIAHHGGKSSNSQIFINQVNPRAAIISVGAKNRYGHPDESTLDELKNLLFYRTDQSGDIEVLTDGKSLEVKTEK